VLCYGACPRGRVLYQVWAVLRAFDQDRMTDIYTIDIAADFTSVVYHCIQDAISRLPEPRPIIDIRAWMQVWKESSCGFGEPGIVGRYIAPCVVVKFNHSLRYVYHDGKFAFVLDRKVAIPYYDGVNNRHMPGQRDWKFENLME
jgi:hypothetical protein